MKIFIIVLIVFLSFSNGRHHGDSPIIEKISSAQSAPAVSSVSTTVSSPTSNVTVNVTWTFTTGTNVSSIVMIVKNLQSAQWAAIGLGQAQHMGETHVFMCKRLSNDTIVLNRYKNPFDHLPPEHAGSEEGGVLTLGPQTFTDGVVTCQFTLSNFTTQTFVRPNALLKPLSQSRSYYPLFAIGLLHENNEPQKHSDDSHTALPNQVQLNQHENILYRLSNSDNVGTMK